jgi:uncharacterized Zn finger protein (UPF0148 family)
MSGTTREGEPAVAAMPTDPKELQAQIERTRAELAETVAALAAKTDLRARAAERVGAMTARARRRARTTNDAVPARAAWPLAAVAALGVVAVALVAWRRNGRGRR